MSDQQRCTNKDEYEDGSGEGLIGVALSGGGQRAMLFSLGALLFLVDCGANRSVRAISSVSGGSWTNAYVGLRCDFRAVPEELFESIVHHLVWRSCQVEQRSAHLYYAFGLLFTLMVFVSYILGLFSDRVVLALSIGTATSVAATLYLLLEFRRARHKAVAKRITVNRSDNARPRAGSLFSAGKRARQETDHESNRFGVPVTALRSGRKSHDESIDHVICATDLESGDPERGRHVFFSGSEVSGTAYGRGDASSIRLSDALAASAAFPILFRPVTIDTETVRFDKEPPNGRLKLADGGVHDNLGLPWMNLKIGGAARDIDCIVAVNSSWAPLHQKMRFGSPLRMAEVLHQSNVAARIAAAKSQFSDPTRPGAVVSIGDSVHTVLAEALDWVKSIRDDQRRDEAMAQLKYAREVIETTQWHHESTWPLDSETGESTNWEQLARDTARVPTTIFRLKPLDARRLLFHGYVLTLLKLAIYFGVRLPDGIDPRPLERFEELVGNVPDCDEPPIISPCGPTEDDEQDTTMASSGDPQ